MSARLDELERLIAAATPGVLEADGETDEIATRGPWGHQSLLCYQRLPMPGMEAQFRNPGDKNLLVALRNAAPALLAIARAAHDVAECLCLPGEPEAYATLGERLRSALAALESVGKGGPE